MLSVNFPRKFHLLMKYLNLFLAEFDTAVAGCCEFGKQWSLDGKSCNKLPPKFSTALGGASLCTTTAGECCESTNSAFQCYYGYWDFNKLKSCNYESSVAMSSQCNDRQSCCLCCQIGKRAFEDHGTCDPNIMLPEPCKSSYLACCEERILNQVNPIIPIPSKPTTPPPTTKRTTTTTTTTTVYIPTTRKRSVCEQFGNTLCDHICVDNPEKFGKTFWCECRDGFERVDEKCVPIKTRVCVGFMRSKFEYLGNDFYIAHSNKLNELIQKMYRVWSFFAILSGKNLFYGKNDQTLYIF